MSKYVLIIHGITGHAGINWQQWLADTMKQQGYQVIMPSLPKTEHPDREEWLITLAKLIKDIPPSELTIVGHSLGVAIALDLIELAADKVQKLIAVSGFSYNYGAELNGYFMDQKQIDFQKVNNNLQHKVVVYGDDDPYVPQDALLALAKSLQVEPIIIDKGGHLNASAGYSQFPLLLKHI